MKHIRILLIAVLSVIVIVGQSQDYPNEKPYIEVVGTAEMEIVPDQIYLSIVLKEKYDNKTKISIAEQEVKLKAALTNIGIDLKNLTLSDANADYVKVKWSQKDVLTKKDYSLLVSDALSVGNVFKTLDELAVTDAFISKVSHSKMDSLRKEVKVNAIKGAKAKADYLLEAIGEKTGKVLIVKEMEGSPMEYLSNVMMGRAAGYSNSSMDEDGSKLIEEIEFKKIKLQSGIYVKFLIQ